MGGLVFWRNALIHHAQITPSRVDSLIEQWRQENYPDGFLGWYALRKRIVAASLIQTMLENLFAERQEANARHQPGVGAPQAAAQGIQVTRTGIKRRETEARIKARAESRVVMEQKMRESGIAPVPTESTTATSAAAATTSAPHAIPAAPALRKSAPTPAEAHGTVHIPLPSPRFSKTSMHNRDSNEESRYAAVPRPKFLETDTPPPELPEPVPAAAPPEVPPPERPKTGTIVGIKRRATDGQPAAASGPNNPPPMAPMVTSTEAPRVGSQFGDILLTRILGQGGAGIVYHGWNLNTEMPCAVKLLLKSPALDPRDEANMTAFRREAEITARLSHPNIVCVLSYGEEMSFPFMELEYVDGLSAAELLRYAGRVTPSRAIKMVMAACEGLDHALGNGIVHRDVKPGNFLLDRLGQVKVSDFGLAYTYVPQTSGALGGKNIMGTPTYMAPEQSIPGSQVDYRADIYALGITLYHMIAGVPPFPGRDPAEIIFAHRNQPPPPLSQYVSNLPGGLWAVISHMIEKSPNDRPDSYTEILQSLKNF
ncbi:MAG TPA: serine/threonine-protein kinase [Planctomycetota bacterium]|nr:serine/threonine-protein kinase [Planctomycetota bacterium]